jgi:hypothetical protein
MMNVHVVEEKYLGAKCLQLKITVENVVGVSNWGLMTGIKLTNCNNQTEITYNENFTHP